MSENGTANDPLRPIVALGIAAFLGWTAISGSVFGWHVKEERQAAIDDALQDARNLLVQETAVRLWPGNHGGAGTPVDLVEVGRRYGVEIRTPAPSPLRPGNTPDDWETLALKALLAGQEEVRGQARLDGQPFLRMMRPLLADDSCVHCHSMKAGAVVGGLAISMPLASRRDATTRRLRAEGLALLGIWLAVSAALAGAAAVMGRRALVRQREMDELRATATALRQLGAGPDPDGASDRLRQSEVRLAEAQRIARLGNWTWHRDDGEFLCSEEVFRIFGHPPGEVAPSREGFLAAMVPEDRNTLIQAEEAALAEQSPLSLDLRILRPDGNRRWVHLEAIAGQSRLDGTIQDITERKEREEAMERAAQELARANIQLERFAYVAAHDLQEPLRNIVSYSQLLGKRYTEALSGDGRDYLSMVIGAATRMRILVGDLMTYSRLDSRAQPFRRIDMGEAVGGAEASLHEAIAETGAQIVLGPMPTIKGDEMQMALVFQHLIGNAIKFHREGVTPRVDIGARLEGKDWLFWVRDNGIGIEPQYHEQIFEVFKRLHPPAEYPGTGIGLAIGRRVIERHGGRIWVNSVPGQGSTFFFTVPVRA